MPLALFGKVPGHADYVSAGWPAPGLRPVESWLSDCLTQCRAQAGAAAWESVYDAAPAWRFWIGEAVPGGAATGVMLFSRDAVGRRFPVLLAEVGAPSAPPFQIEDFAWYDAAEAALREIASPARKAPPEAELERAGAALASAPALQGAAPSQPGFWASAARKGPAEVLQDAQLADRLRAASGASYWWSGGGADGGVALHVATGLPDAEAFAWFLRGLGSGNMSGAAAAR